MSNIEPTVSVSRRDHGLALADALLESNRRLQPLPVAAHDRVKRRLRARLGNPAFRRARWLRPLVIAGSLLLWGTAFGIAIDHFVIEHNFPPRPQPQPTNTPDKPHARRPRTRPEITVANGQAAPSEPTDPPSVATPTIEPALPAPAKSASIPTPTIEPALPTPASMLPPLLASARPRTSRAPARSSVAFVDRAAISPPASTVPADREPLPATGSIAPAALPAVVPEAPAPAPAAIALTTPPAPRRPPEKAAAEDLSEERLLAAAVRALRAKQDAGSALLALDAYRARYPQGRLFVEASVLRVDALTALHRQPEALRALDELDLNRMPGGLERRLQRGELRAASGRLQEAVADFDGVLSHAREQELLQRALGGRAQARQRLGDSAGARADAIEYLRRFPVGPFAPQARDLSRPQTVGP